MQEQVSVAWWFFSEQGLEPSWSHKFSCGTVFPGGVCVAGIAWAGGKGDSFEVGSEGNIKGPFGF